MNPSDLPPDPIMLNQGIDFSNFFIHTWDSLVAFYPTFFSGLKHTTGFLVGLSFPLSFFFLIVIIYCVEQLKRIRRKEEEIYDAKIEPAYEEVAAKADDGLTRRWETVTNHIESPNQNDWKQAILEADIMLDDILSKMGYRGESVGEKLKRAVKGDFQSLDDAWEAHKVRNQIAHEGSDFAINHHEAKHVIQRYKRVFEEFYYI